MMSGTRLRRALILPGLVLVYGSVPVPRPPATGTVEGRVMFAAATRRVATHYLGGGPAQHPVQSVPAVVLVTSTPATRVAASATVRMAQRDTAFQPAVLIVAPGATVEFPNHDPFFHNVFSYSAPKRFDLGRYPRGESRSVRFDEPGMVKVYCEVHDFMRSVVVVTEHEFHAIAAEDGSFTIRGVPAGRHTLLVWHPEHGEREVNVTVTDGGTTRVDVRLP